jgi:hypothetical protein
MQDTHSSNLGSVSPTFERQAKSCWHTASVGQKIHHSIAPTFCGNKICPICEVKFAKLISPFTKRYLPQKASHLVHSQKNKANMLVGTDPLCNKLPMLPQNYDLSIHQKYL